MFRLYLFPLLVQKRTCTSRANLAVSNTAGTACIYNLKHYTCVTLFQNVIFLCVYFDPDLRSGVRCSDPLVALAKVIFHDNLRTWKRVQLSKTHLMTGRHLPPRVEQLVKVMIICSAPHDLVTFPDNTRTQAVVKSRVETGTTYLTYIEPTRRSKHRALKCGCSCKKPEVSSEICEHVVSHVKKAGLNVEDFIPIYQTALYWSGQYEALRIDRARFPNLYHGRRERPSSLLEMSTLKPPMVDVRDTILTHFPNIVHQFT